MKKLLISALLLLLMPFVGCSPKTSIENTLPKVINGTIERLQDFKSEYVGPRNIDIWLPQNYSSDNKYSVLYMHDGQMLFDSTTTWNHQEWGVDETVHRLITERKIPNTIVVGIWNTELRHSEYFPQKPFESLPQELQDSLINKGHKDQSNSLFKSEVISDNYLKFIVYELKPYVDSNYSSHSDPDRTCIFGSSMGGLISMYALCEYPKIFGSAGCMSTHWPGTFDTLNNPIPEKFVEYLQTNLPKDNNHKIYFDYGTKTLDALYESSQLAVDSVLIAKGYDDQIWKTLKFDGADHSEKSWNQRLHIPLKFLLSDQ